MFRYNHHNHHVILSPSQPTKIFSLHGRIGDVLVRDNVLQPVHLRFGLLVGALDDVLDADHSDDLVGFLILADEEVADVAAEHLLHAAFDGVLKREEERTRRVRIDVVMF